MASYLHPGVYVEEIPSGSKPIEAAGTSTACFIGYAVQGPLSTAGSVHPTFIGKWDHYQDRFGGLQDLDIDHGDQLGHAVRGFFLNGGGKAYVVRLADGAVGATGAVISPLAADPANPAPADKIITFTAADPGAWGDQLQVRLEVNGGEVDVAVGRKYREGAKTKVRILENFQGAGLDNDAANALGKVVNDGSVLVTCAVGAAGPLMKGVSVSGDLTDAVNDQGKFAVANKKLKITVNGAVKEIGLGGANLTPEETAAAIQTKVREGAAADADELNGFTCAWDAAAKTLTLTTGEADAASSVVVTDPDAGATAAGALKLGAANGGDEQTGLQVVLGITGGNRSTAVNFSGGDDGASVGADAYDAVFTALEKYRDVNILCLPGQYVGVTADGDANAAVAAAVSHCEKMTNRMVIVDPEPGKELRPGGVSTDNTPTSTYAALYYPWLKVANPYYHAESNPGADRNLSVAPCGFIAGMWAKIDGRRGVWKAPAGIETKLLGAGGLEFQVEDPEQDALNPIGFNCLRTLPNFGRVIWGARTAASKANPEWRYLPVRRTAMFIEESIYGGIQWAVFEPNDHHLWAGLRSNIDSFMNGLFRAGAFQGGKASDAYFVRCGLGDTMTQGDIDRGQVIVIVGFAPVKPAEFVIVRIQQKVGQE